jgi:hypothetical protein
MAEGGWPSAAAADPSFTGPLLRGCELRGRDTAVGGTAT